MMLLSARTRIIFSILLSAIFVLSPLPAQASAKADVPPLDEFVEEVVNGESDVLRGVYIPDVLADPVALQPEENPAYVSSREDTLTQFEMASHYGSTGLLAHNYRAGKDFSLLETGQLIYLIYGDGRIESFIVVQFMRFRALRPNSVTSNFVDLDNGERLSAPMLFLEVYDKPGYVIMQTCINAFGNNSWGRLFVIAEPYDEGYFQSEVYLGFD